jgi:uncharacterized protein (TIGR00369 family)
MDVQEYLDDIPFQETLGIEIIRAQDGHAEAKIELGPDLSSSQQRVIAHGGVVATLADTVGGAATISLNNAVTPTIDLQINYLAPAENDLSATGEVIRNGNSVATVDIEITDTQNTHVASGQGVYKTSGEEPMSWVQPKTE